MRDWLKREPIVITSGKGATLRDARGRTYLDANSSIWTNLHGHNHPRINVALRRQFPAGRRCKRRSVKAAAFVSTARLVGRDQGRMRPGSKFGSAASPDATRSLPAAVTLLGLCPLGSAKPDLAPIDKFGA